MRAFDVDYLDRGWIKRLLHFICMLLILLGIGLGAIWPSIFTIGAIVILPAFFIFAGLLIWPKFACNRPVLQGYLFFSLVLTILEWTYFLVQLRSAE